MYGTRGIDVPHTASHAAGAGLQSSLYDPAFEIPTNGYSLAVSWAYEKDPRGM